MRQLFRMAVAAAAVVAGTLAVTGYATVAATEAGAQIKPSAPQDKVTICHATASESNPYVVETVDQDSILNGSGHGNSGINVGDIVRHSRMHGELPSTSWTTEGRAIFNHGCKKPGYPPPRIRTSASFAKEISVDSKHVSVTCKFAPDSTISITLNGAAYGTATAPNSGTFLETLTAKKPHKIALNGGPAVRDLLRRRQRVRGQRHEIRRATRTLTRRS